MGVVGIHGRTGYRITMSMQCLEGGGIKVQRTNEGERERPSRKTEQNAVPAATPQDGVPQADLDRFAVDKEIYPDDKSSIIFRAGMKNVIGIVKKQDTIDPVKHGHWIKMPHIWSVMYKCSACGSFKDTQYCYCPRCGARMDGDESESD